MLRKRVLSLLLTTCFVSPMLIASVQSAEVNVVELTVKDAHTALQNKSYTSKQLTEAIFGSDREVQSRIQRDHHHEP